MIKRILYTGLLGLLTAASAPAQVDTSKSKAGIYFFEGEDVVFEFDSRYYEKLMRKRGQDMVDFADLHILAVVVKGDVENWSDEGWRLERYSKYKYRLRKRIADFKDAPNWQFRLLVNGTYFTPVEVAAKKQGVMGLYDLKNPNLPKVVASDTGNVHFYLEGFREARKVVLTGTFNDWDEHALEMFRIANGWEITLYLPAGEYEYKFIADGQWTEDPANPEKRVNQYGTLNSVLRVTKSVMFKLEGYQNAQKVVLAGTFNGWNEEDARMKRSESGWYLKVPLVPGKYEYKFIIDGQWITDPGNPRQELSWNGHVNSIVFVK